MDNISDNNPHLEEMKERGWAWLQRSKTLRGGHKHGAPYTDDGMASENVERLHPFDEDEGIDLPASQELIIVSWEE